MTGEAVFATTRAPDGAALARYRWRPAGPPRRILLNVTGLGDHAGLYPNLVAWALARGWAVHAHEPRGNGRSPGRRGHVERLAVFRADLAAVVDDVRREEGGAPLVLLGNSLGGLVALDYALERPDGLAGLALAAPAIGEVGVPRALLLLARLLSGVWPTFTLETGLDLSGLARDPAIVAAVLADPLFHRKSSARLGTEVLDAIESVHARAARLAVPTFILHGTADRMVPISGSRRLAAGPAAPRVTLVECAGAYHALFADRGFEERLAALGRWADALP